MVLTSGKPRTVLSEMGLDLESSTEVRVWDSSAEVRYMVLPQRPADTQDMTEKQLMALVSRDSMVGVTRIEPPGAR